MQLSHHVALAAPVGVFVCHGLVKLEVVKKVGELWDEQSIWN